MDPEQTFLRVHARLSGMLARLLTPRFRAVLEYLCLFNAVVLLALLMVMHVNFVAQPGCSTEFSGAAVADAQLVQIKITGSWNRIAEDDLIDRLRFKRPVKDSNVQECPAEDIAKHHQNLLSHPGRDVGGERWNVLAAKFWSNLVSNSWRRREALKFEVQSDAAEYARAPKDTVKSALNPEVSSDGVLPPYVSPRPLTGPGRGPLGTALLHYLARWSSYVAVFLKRGEQSLRSFWQVWRITGWEPVTASSKGDRRGVTWNKLDPVLADLSDHRRKALDPTYLYSVEKGYLMLSEAAKFHHGIKTVNVTVSAQDVCFGNRWQQLLIDNFVGYDTILMNSLLHARGKGYLYNFQTKELYNLNYLQEFSLAPHGFEDYIVVKCGVLITSLFVFFTTTMSVSFTLRETQARMLKFTVQLQHHARHQLPTYRLIFVHVVESLVFVPIMIGILFFLFEFFDDQLLAFMVLTLVWLCELYTMISVRTPLSMQYFPRFFFLYFMVFHVYFFSYTYGFSYLAFSATGAFMQHLVLYFWNQFEVPALQNFLQRRAMFQQQGLHISSAILQVARLTNGSLVGDGRNGVSINPMGQRPGSPFAGTRHPENGSPRGDGSRPGNSSVLEGTNGRGLRTPHASSFYPFAIRSLSSVSLNGNGGIFDSNMGPSSGLSGIVSPSSPNSTPRDSNSTPRDSENRTERAGRADGERRVGAGAESVPQSPQSGRDAVNPAVRGSSPPEDHMSDSSTGEATPPSGGGGPLSALGSLVPWMLGTGPGAVISSLPIFRDFQDERQDAAAATEQEREERALPRGAMSSQGETQLRRRFVSLPPSQMR